MNLCPGAGGLWVVLHEAAGLQVDVVEAPEVQVHLDGEGAVLLADVELSLPVKWSGESTCTSRAPC